MKPYRYDSQLLQSQTTARRLLLNLSGLLLFHTNQMKKKTESNNRVTGLGYAFTETDG